MSQKFHVHFMGIGGSGASAVAAIAQAQGYQVSGCDRNIHNEFTTPFERNQLQTGHDPKHLQTVQLLAISPAIRALDPHNPELAQAFKFGIPTITWQEFMGKYLEQNKTVIAICGTHGKSTTTAMTGLLLEDNQLDPTVELGAIVPKWQKNYRLGESKYFVTEADEFNNNFLVSHPDITIITSIEMDHPEFFASFDDYLESFIQFLSQTKKLIIANMADPNVAEAVKYAMKQTSAAVVDYSKSQFNLELKVPGHHNLMNANAVFHLGLALGIDTADIKHSLETYSGLGRRLEQIGTVHGAVVYSDFGHHPTEIEVTIAALKDNYPDQKIILIYQPHMFSRTKALFDNFVATFKKLPVEKLLLTEIYPSREVDLGLVKANDLVQATGGKTELVADTKQFDAVLKPYLDQHHIIVFMGAGSIDETGRQWVKAQTK